jgi:hypothetical protein
VTYPAIPDPAMSLESLHNTVGRLKESVELVTGQRPNQAFSFPDQLRIIERRSGEASARFAEQIQIQANSLQAVVTRTTTLEADMDDVQASVVAEQTARADADSALASDITTVEAIANGGTASGQVYLIAEAAPAGYNASYGWTLTVNGQSIGMKAMQTTGGIGEISFTANKFRLTDPSYAGGSPQEVFEYNGVTFNFGVPVTVRHQEIGINATANGAFAEGYVASGTTLSTGLTVRANSRLVVIISVSDVSFSIHTVGFSTTLVIRNFQLLIDGFSGFGVMNALDTLVASNYLGGSSYQFYAAVTPTSKSFEVTGLSPGAHTFAVDNVTGYTLGMSIQVVELAQADI